MLMFLGSCTKSSYQKNAINCNNLTPAEKFSCIWFLAMNTSNEKLCAELGVLEGACISGIVSRKAMEAGDANICNKLGTEPVQFIGDYANKIENPREECYIAVAIKNNDESQCERIQERETRDGCYISMARLKGDWALCAKVQDRSSRDFCYSDFARKANNETLCELAGGDRDSCIRIVAEHKKNLEMCATIHSDYERDRCYGRVAGNVTDESLCYRMTRKESLASCLISVAMTKNDETLCKMVEGINVTIGGGLFIRELPNFENTGFSDIPPIESCYLSFASKTQDEKFCMKISTGYVKADCIQFVARFKKNESICFLLTNETQEGSSSRPISARDNCLKRVAYEKNDKAVCELIKTDSMKEECLGHFAVRWQYG